MKIPSATKPVYVKIKEGAIIYKFGMGGCIPGAVHEQHVNERERFSKVPPRKTKDFDWNEDKWKYLQKHVQDGHDMVLVDWDTYVHKDFVTPIKVPSLTKNKRAYLVRNSEWTVDEDMPFFVSDEKDNVYHITIPAGTVVKVLNPKSKDEYLFGGMVGGAEKCIEVEIQNKKMKMPNRFIGGMTCTKHGNAKTYWKLLDRNGEPVRTKRYDNLGAVKSSIRIITGLVTEAYDDQDNEIGPWFIDGAAAAPGFTAGETPLEYFDEWEAVEYSAVDDSVLQRVDLKDWYIKAKWR